jgi:hypothetical protein
LAELVQENMERNHIKQLRWEHVGWILG